MSASFPNSSAAQMQEIQILSYLEPSGNPRVPKEAEALAAAGFGVRVVTSALPGSAAIRMEEPAGWTIERLNKRQKWHALWRHRLTRKMAAIWPRDMRAQVGAYGSLFTDLVRFLRASSPQNLRIAHLEPALLAAARGGWQEGAGCDFEDWYSEDLLPGSRSAALTAALKSAEQSALRNAPFCWCTSQAMASALGQAYGTQEPLVVRNVFPRRYRESIDRRWIDRPDMARRAVTNDPVAPRPDIAPVSFHWFSQTIGPGRGLELILGALEGLRGEWELHLRGNLGSYRQWFEELCSATVRQRVRIHALVGTDELTSRISEHDIGLACELRRPRSRDVTITNKVFQYLQAGLAVLASDTEGQKEAARSAPDAMHIVRSGDPGSARAALQQLVDDRSKLRAMRSAAWEAGSRLCWENESPKLVEAVEKALDQRSATR
jgi:hypothetical protein